MDDHGHTVLVVDDDQGVREAVTAALEVEGYQVRTAPGGVEALIVLGEWDPEVIVLDLLMPRLDGIGVCRQLRSLGDQTPILMLTARDALSDRVAGLDAGADDYLIKPFELDELLAGCGRCSGAPIPAPRPRLRSAALPTPRPAAKPLAQVAGSSSPKPNQPSSRC